MYSYCRNGVLLLSLQPVAAIMLGDLPFSGVVGILQVFESGKGEEVARIMAAASGVPHSPFLHFHVWNTLLTMIEDEDMVLPTPDTVIGRDEWYTMVQEIYDTMHETFPLIT